MCRVMLQKDDAVGINEGQCNGGVEGGTQAMGGCKEGDSVRNGTAIVFVKLGDKEAPLKFGTCDDGRFEGLLLFRNESVRRLLKLFKLIELLNLLHGLEPEVDTG